MPQNSRSSYREAHVSWCCVEQLYCAMQHDATQASLVACSARFVRFRLDFDEFLIL